MGTGELSGKPVKCWVVTCDELVSCPECSKAETPDKILAPKVTWWAGQILAFNFLGGQHGRVVSTSDSQSGGPEFESHSDHQLDLFLGSPEFNSSTTLVNSQLVCFLPVGVFNHVMFDLDYLFVII